MKLFVSLYSDEDVSVLVATLLRARGFDVTTVLEEGMFSQSDNQLLVYTVLVERCLLTPNRVDFEQLHLKYRVEEKYHFGVIVVPQKNAQVDTIDNLQTIRVFR